MKYRSLQIFLAAASLSVSSGCATDGMSTAWSRSMAVFRPGSEPDGDASVADSKGSRFRKSSPDDELSAEFKEAQKTFKNTEQTLLAWARYQEDVGEYAEARKKYRELFIAYPENTEASLGLARIERLTGRAQQAEEILSGLEKKRPGDIVVKLELGRMYSELERWPEALSKFEQASELDPNDQTCRYELGVALAKTHRFDAALSHLTFAVGASAANYNVGYILHEEGNDADAIEWFHNALQLHPDQQTAEKTKVMLSKLMPTDSATDTAAAIAQNRTRQNTSQSIVSRVPATRQVSLQYSPAEIPRTDSGQLLPVVAGTRQNEGELLPPAVSENFPATTTSAPSIQDGSAFRGASYSAADSTTGKAFYGGSSRPTVWNSPTALTESNVTQQPAAPKEPPLWRAHNN